MTNLLLALSLYYNFCQEVHQELLGQQYTEEGVAVCSLLVEDAQQQNLDVDITLATAWEESRFTQQHKPTRFKCIGPLQIKYQYWCPNAKDKITIVKADGLLSKCDPYFHGVRALKYYIKKFKPLTKALCYYNNSKKCKKTYKSNYVKGVLKHLKIIINVIVKDKYKSLQ